MNENKYYEEFKLRADNNEDFEKMLEEIYEDVSRNIIKVATYMKCVKYLNEMHKKRMITKQLINEKEI